MRHAVFLVLCSALLIGCSDSARSPTGRSTEPDEILADLSRWDSAPEASRQAAAADVARRLPGFALLREEAFSCGGQRHTVAIFAHEKTGMEFVLAPVGTFQMGSPRPEMSPSYCGAHPAHTVTLSRAFLIARTDVTQLVWRRAMGTKPS